MLAIVDEESARLDRLIGQAMEMAQLDAAAIQVNRKLQSLREVIDLVVEEARTLLHDRRVETQLPEDLQPVSMDRELVRRVLRHLIENAVKYSPPASPIGIAARTDGEKLLVSVSDHGPGIDETERPFIFEKFFRGKKQRQRVQGTGMGLAIVKAILEAHGGGIDVASQPGKGSVFTFWLPFQAGDKRD
jgi:two-component system sensor histidine kinase KdpD